MARRVNKTALRIKADVLFSQRIRAYGQCARCGTTQRLQCAHIVSRRYLSTRWDDDNAIALCAGCHVYFTHRPLEWEEWVVKRFGAEWYEGLKKRALKPAKPDYEAIVERLKKAA